MGKLYTKVSFADPMKVLHGPHFGTIGLEITGKETPPNYQKLSGPLKMLERLPK